MFPLVWLMALVLMNNDFVIYLGQKQEPPRKHNQHSGVLLQYTFVVSLEKLQFKAKKNISCIVNYQYNLFCATVVSTGPECISISNDGDKTYTIPAENGFNMYNISPNLNRSDVEIHFKNYPLELKIFDLDTHIGNCEVNLSQLFTDKAKTNSKQKRSIKENFPISNLECNDIIGTIEGLFALDENECIQCKSCKNVFRIVTFLVHVKHRNNANCRAEYSKEEMQVLERKSLKLKKEKKSLQQWQKYDPVKRAELHKSTYNTVKRGKQYDTETKRIKENRATKSDRERSEYRARKENSSLHTSASTYLHKCLENSKILNLSQETVSKLESLIAEAERLFKSFELQIDEAAEQAEHVALWTEVNELYKSIFDTLHGQKFSKSSFIGAQYFRIVNKAELAFTDTAEHIEYSTFPGQAIPKLQPCLAQTPCRNCKEATNKDKEYFEKCARQKNDMYYTHSKYYFEICEKNLGRNLFINYNKNKQVIEKMSKKIEFMHGEIELEINKTVQLATEIVWWRDLDKLYGKIYSIDENHHRNDQPLIFVQWKDVFMKIESIFYNLAEHVDEWNNCYGGFKDFGILQMPKPEIDSKPNKCDNLEKCKKCLASENQQT